MRRRSFLALALLPALARAQWAGPLLPSDIRIRMAQQAAGQRFRTPLNRSKILVIFNTDAAAVTSDGFTSEQMADFYALNRGFTTDGVSGHYYKIGLDFGAPGVTLATGYANANPLGGSGSWPIVDNMTVAKSYAPAQSPALNNTRYTGVALLTAIANMISDNGIQAVFCESMVPKLLGGCYNSTGGGYYQNPPDAYLAGAPLVSGVPVNSRNSAERSALSAGNLYTDLSGAIGSQLKATWRTASVATALIYGRIGYPGCAYSDLQRLVSDANWAEGQDNRSKLHIVGGKNYQNGGDQSHCEKANAIFAGTVPLPSIGYFSDAVGACVGSAGSWSFNSYWSGPGSLTDVKPFAMLYGSNPFPTNNAAFTPQRGGWAYGWGSSCAIQGYWTLQHGGTASFISENEPLTSGISAVDCIATFLTLGFSMAEAWFMSGLNTSGAGSVYGVPDYAPYSFTNTALTLE